MLLQPKALWTIKGDLIYTLEETFINESNLGKNRKIAEEEVNCQGEF